MPYIFSKGFFIGVCVLALCCLGFSPALNKRFPAVFGAHNDSKKIDLKIDSQCHYYNYDPSNANAISEGELSGLVDVGCFFNGKSFGTWSETDLGREKFFNFSDLKPGDRGEDTISLHATGGDGCGQIIFRNIKESGNECNEPETQSADPDCKNKAPGKKEMKGELREALEFSMWLDQGQTPGFQGTGDSGEGDNIFNEKDVLLFSWKNINKCPSVQQIRKHLRQARKLSFSECQVADPDGDGKNTKNGVCQGLPRDGRMIESTVYYYGLGWRLPKETDNEVQTDSLTFDLAFSVKSNQACSPCANQCYECDSRCED